MSECLPRTERQNPLTRDIDTWPVRKILEVMNAEDHRVASAVALEITSIVKATKMVAEAVAGGRRVLYVGSGTSGRLGVLDAAEWQPTFGVGSGVIDAVIAGGTEALWRAVEGQEDREDAGRQAVKQKNIGRGDVVVGIAASGRTPFTLGALQEARSRGASTIAIVGDPSGPLSSFADVVISPDVGPEVIAGSTRLKNGTAQKMVLNMISTAAMILLGRTYSNLMAGASATNAKLSRRARLILSEATGAPMEKVEEALEDAEGDVPVALISLLTGATAEEARGKLRESKGSIRRAIELAGQRRTPSPGTVSTLGEQAGAGTGSFTPRALSGKRDGAGDNRLFSESAGGTGSMGTGDRSSVPHLEFARPEEVGLDPVALERAFDVVRDAVGNGEGEIPGAVCAVVRQGKVVGPRAFGLAVRTPVRMPVTPATVFDLASLTKVVATLPSILVLMEMGKLRLDDRVSLFLPDFGANGKESITIRHLLTHTSGLPAHVKFYEMGLDRAGIVRKICEMEASSPGEHVVYSDLGFIILGEIVERITGKRLDEFARENIWRPLGMNDTCFLPGESSRHRIAATEYRTDLKKLMWGEVHDENAYAMGGIAGHAGLFSTITDLARYALMWLGEGEFGPVRVLSRNTVRLATKEHVNKEDRRGLGWALKSRAFSSGGDLLSDASYGHTGFTGTSLWCDPETRTGIILLTNRVHAGRDGTAIIELRPRFANAVAAAIGVRNRNNLS
ncbi:MAG TPA: N-acetylmuramic acid 6-phosphate etherase [Firmicutes bacterium]|nr:N-acetylmuramic acid 6-phosphate etherase [Candidatus Fermentithermobacillaceae bacterium]